MRAKNKKQKTKNKETSTIAQKNGRFEIGRQEFDS
jgi:hypothetical protein